MSATFGAGGAILGALTGVLLPRVVYRLSVEQGTPPRSLCAVCRTPFVAGARGWVRMGARCEACRSRLGPRTTSTVTAAALAGGLAAGALYPAEADGGRAVVAAALVLFAFWLSAVVGVVLGAIDLACLRLPNPVVAGLFAVVLVLLGAAAAVAGTPAAAHDLLRALAAALVLSGGYLLLALIPGSSLGLGDVKLCGVLGLLLGWLSWGAVLLGAVLPHLLNGPVALGLLAARRVGRKTSLPLGPALLAGGLLAVVGDAVVQRLSGR